jgi:signal transduction histidine kinase
MDTYVFVESTDGVELVNAAQPSLEGRNLMDLRDLKGKALVPSRCLCGGIRHSED